MKNHGIKSTIQYMEQIVKQYILDNGLLHKGQKVIVALSGGMDSVALFYVLNTLKEELGVCLVCAHYDHGIRETAGRDAEFAKEFSKVYGADFYLGKGDVPAYAEEKGLSIETAARELRYDFLYKLKQQIGADCIATAHHKTDQVETVLLNIIRGSGILGLAGMKSKNNEIIRPLLCVTREQIERYITEKGLPYVHDETNDDTAYKRNSIRHELVPMLKKYNPNIDEAIVRLSRIAAEDQEFINGCAVKSMEKMFSSGNNEYILIRELFLNEHLCVKHAIIRVILSEIHSLKDMSYSRLAEIIHFIETSKTGSKFIINERYIIRHEYDKLYFAENKMIKKAKTDKSVLLMLKNGIYKTVFGTFKIEITDVENAFKEKGEYFDLDKLKGYNAVFRYRREGDTIKPLGGHTKKLKDYFIDKKLPQEEREETVLLASGSEVLWAVGNCISDRIKIDENTKECIHVIFEGKKRNA